MSKNNHPQAAVSADLLELQRRLLTWHADKVGTLMFIVQHGEVLLIRKKRGHGAGKINGPGGKIDPGESPLQAAIRETQEEVGLQVATAQLMAELRFVDQAQEQWLGYAFISRQSTGTPIETDEATPLWYPLADLPFDQMWPDDEIWLPKVLAGQRIKGDFLFRDNLLVAHQLNSLLEE